MTGGSGAVARGALGLVERHLEEVVGADIAGHLAGRLAARVDAAARRFGLAGPMDVLRVLEADGERGAALLDDLLAEFSAAGPYPVLSGLSSGHTEPNLPLPFGPRALLDPEKGALAFLEGLVL